MESLGILIFKMSLVVWLELTPPQQMGIVDALARQYSEYFQCEEFKINIVVGKFVENQFGRDRELRFYFDCSKRFGGEYEKNNLLISIPQTASDNRGSWRLQDLHSQRQE